ncbi:MAG: dihydroorotate dehydrogenase electron transfer subunit [Paludibacteraceae bacterium]|nr:dihydroorotate dehydrogenase electron transfer subunit [Paludibacteraceae bacterium]
MMKQRLFEIKSNEQIAKNVYRMQLCGDTTGILPGQFVNIRVEGQFLRRPISVCNIEPPLNNIEPHLTIIYKVVGVGTEAMSRLPIGTQLNVLTVLGNGYDLSKAGNKPLLVGGGVGVPPMYMLARQLREMGKAVRVILGFNTKDEVFYEEEFRALGCDVTVTTVDGSHGVKGFVTNALNGKQSYYYTCGPLPMIKALLQAAGTNGEVSMEERMGCGFGACMGCTIQTTQGPKRVCKEGPVFAASELLL